MMIDGTVPKAAGMSSSSALVCVAGLATAYTNNCQITKVFQLQQNDCLSSVTLILLLV